MSFGQSKRWTRAFLYVASFAPDALYGWPTVLFVRLFWGEYLRWEDGVLRCRAREDSWLQRTHGQKWSGITLSPHAVVYGYIPLWPEELQRPSSTQRHEHVHVEQGETAQLVVFIEALLLLPVLLGVGEPVWAGILCPLLWISGHGRMAGSSSATALLRGESGYVGSHIEEAGRALEQPEHDRLHE